MEFSAATTLDLAELSTALDLNVDELTAALASLTHDLSTAVSSYLGLQLVLLRSGCPLVLSVFATPSAVAGIESSLQVPLAALLRSSTPRPGGGEATGHLTVFAGRPGAFVDLAADLSFALRPPATAPAPRRLTGATDLAGLSGGLRLDEDRIPIRAGPLVEAAAARSTVDRALGFLIGQGHRPDDAHAELVQRSALSGVTVVVFAAQLLRPAGL